MWNLINCFLRLALGVIKSKQVGWAWHVRRMGKKEMRFKILVAKYRWKRPIWKLNISGGQY
jgi:hypothetical protein